MKLVLIKKIALMMVLSMSFCFFSCQKEGNYSSEYETSSDKKTEYNITFMGDSITQGYFGTPGFVELIAKQEYADTVQNLGMARSTIGVAESYKEDEVAGTNPFVYRFYAIRKDVDIIFVLGGTNDYGNTLTNNVTLGKKGDTDEHTFYGALNYLIDGIKTTFPNAKLVMCTPIQRQNSYTNWPQADENNFGYLLTDYCKAIKEMAEEKSVYFLDLYNEIQEFDSKSNTFMKYFTDGIHPNTEGHRLIAGVINGYIKELINLK